MTLIEAAPYHTELHEDLDRDPSQMTIGKLHEHCFYLGTEILITGAYSCTICKDRYTWIIWQIHTDYALPSILQVEEISLSASITITVRFMSVPKMQKWKRLPFLWHRQDIGEVGLIKSLRYVRYDPYPLPQGSE